MKKNLLSVVYVASCQNLQHSENSCEKRIKNILYVRKGFCLKKHKPEDLKYAAHHSAGKESVLKGRLSPTEHFC